jgi:protease II
MTNKEREYEQAMKDHEERIRKEQEIEESYESDEYLCRMGSHEAWKRLNPQMTEE